jgi:hypothetical protein
VIPFPKGHPWPLERDIPERAALNRPDLLDPLDPLHPLDLDRLLDDDDRPPDADDRPPDAA